MVHLTQAGNPLRLRDVMTVGEQVQTLQTALDDTIPGSAPGSCYFTQGTDPTCYGTLRLRKTVKVLRVYDALGQAPDLSAISIPRELFFHVKVRTVWSRSAVLRPIRLHELFVVWDYEGKLESKHQGFKHSMQIL